MARSGPRRPRLVAALALLLAIGSITFPVRSALGVSADNWNLTYAATDGDGIAITNAFFNGVRVFTRTTLPFVIVTYSGESCCTDQLGNSVRKSGPTFSDFAGGFSISAVYCFGSCLPYDTSDSFAYKYIETYTFYSGGTWKAHLDVFGPGIATSSLYEVFWRVDYDITDAGGDVIESYTNGAWSPISTETKSCDDGSNATGGYEWRQSDASPLRRYSVDPLSATRNYCDLALRFHVGEEGGLGSKPYPTMYDNNESINNADVVQWYWGYRVYSRPGGCLVSGVGCTTPVPVSFWADDSGY